MSTKEEELFDAMARDGVALEYIKDMLTARRELFGGGSKEGCARCSAEAHAAMTAPEGGAHVTDPSKPTKPVVAHDGLRVRLEALKGRLHQFAGAAFGEEEDSKAGHAYRHAARLVDEELAK